MKKILSIIGAIAVAAGAHGQGFILTQGSSAGVLTNNLSGNAPGALASGKTATAAGGFYYALLFSQTALSGVASPTNSGWTLATLSGGGGLSISNYTLLAGGINGSGASAGVAVNMAAATLYNVELVGWSSSLGGQNAFSTVESELASGNWSTTGYFGYTSVGTMTPFATAGAGDPAIFPTTFANGSLTLYSVPVPEPSTLALAALGGASLLLFRRRKV